MRIVLLSGGIGGARLARGFADLPEVELTVVVNVGDDETVYGLPLSPDLDTVCYTLADEAGPEGWGRAGDTWEVMTELARFGTDTSFRVGDRDLALNLFRAERLAAGWTLGETTAAVAAALGLGARILPATDDPLRTRVELAEGWVDFQTYYVRRRHADPVVGVRYEGAAAARPAPGVLAAVAAADAVVVAPSNPVLSVAPVLAVPGIEEAVRRRPVVAVSPLVGGRAVKGPTVDVLTSLGIPPTNGGIVEFYRGLVDRFVVHSGDDVPPGVGTLATDTRMPDREASRRLAREVTEWLR